MQGCTAEAATLLSHLSFHGTDDYQAEDMGTEASTGIRDKLEQAVEESTLGVFILVKVSRIYPPTLLNCALRGAAPVENPIDTMEKLASPLNIYFRVTRSNWDTHGNKGMMRTMHNALGEESTDALLLLSTSLPSTVLRTDCCYNKAAPLCQVICQLISLIPHLSGICHMHHPLDHAAF